MSIRIQPYQKHSISARLLGEYCGVLLATPQQVRKHGDFTHIINWGSTEEKFNGNYINPPRRVRDACNKVTTLEILDAQGVPTLPWTTSSDVARTWWDNGETVVIRKLLRASKGRGIILAGRGAKVPIIQAPLYTKYIKKQDEYRVHVARGVIIDIQQKRKRKERNNEDVDYQVRNYRNGWVFCRGGVDAPECVRAASIAAVTALGLDFGGVDVGYNAHHGTACVYEVNTAPGIEGTTLRKYFDALCTILPELRGGAFATRRHAAAKED